MKTIEGRIAIDAPPEKVWREVVDFGSYPKWNTFISKLEGILEERCVFEVCSTSPGRKEIRFRSTLTSIGPMRLEFNGVPKAGFVKDRHVFQVLPAEGGAEFYQRIDFTGLAVPFIGGMIYDSKKGLDGMNEALKRRCEGR